MNKVLAFLSLSRPYQWHKNLFVFAPAFFGGKIGSPQELYATLVLFANFVLASSSVYSMNDIFDHQRDKEHPMKRTRPIPSGKISRREAAFFSSATAALSLAISYITNTIEYVASYVLLNIIYSTWLKENRPLDVLIISLGFIIRVLAGAKVTKVEPSGWLIITTLFLAVFLSTMKRECEIRSRIYERMGIISATLTIVSYSFYAVLERKDTMAILSVLPVFYGITRYYIIAENTNVKDPSVLVFDREIVLSVIIWAILVGWKIYA